MPIIFSRIRYHLIRQVEQIICADIIQTGNSNQHIKRNSVTTKSSTEVQATEQAVQTRFGVGERVELNDVIVTLVSVTESKGSQYNTPTDGNVFVLCEFEIENNTRTFR